VYAPRVIATAGLPGKTWSVLAAPVVRSSQAQVHVTNFDYNHRLLNTMSDPRLTSRAGGAPEHPCRGPPAGGLGRAAAAGPQPTAVPDSKPCGTAESFFSALNSSLARVVFHSTESPALVA
jgi:hypothetical protein